MTWAALLGCAAGCYLLKLAGLAVPDRVLEAPVVRRVAELLPVVLLGALVAVQVFATRTAHGAGLAVDARLAGLAVAAVALLLRWPFLAVVLSAAATAALLRLVG